MTRRNQTWPYWLAVWIIAAATLSAVDAKAETRLYLGALTEHFSGKDYNETHKLALIEHNGLIAGYTDNSYGEDTFLAGIKHRIKTLDVIPDIETSALLIGSYGYRSCTKGWADSARKICPMAAIQIDYTAWERYHPSVVMTPVFVGATGAVVF